jgi:predicted HTH domain antitoxin
MRKTRAGRGRPDERASQTAHPPNAVQSTRREGLITVSSVILELEDELMALLHEANQPVQQTAKELMVLELYRRGTISSGKAAELLGMDRWEFVRHASRLGIPFFQMSAEEWEAESEDLEKNGFFIDPALRDRVLIDAGEYP